MLFQQEEMLVAPFNFSKILDLFTIHSNFMLIKISSLNSKLLDNLFQMVLLVIKNLLYNFQ